MKKNYYVRVWETKTDYKNWVGSEDYLFADKKAASRFTKTLRKGNNPAFAYELGWFDEDACPSAEPFSFWNRKDGLSK